MNNFKDDFWLDKAFTIAIVMLGAIITWFGVEWRKMIKTSFDSKFDEKQKDLKDKVDHLDERVRDLEVYKEVNERVARATEKALYGKNL
jgi:hypothetical protein